jgi:O-succinylbenzoic acid--CoA ligase
VGGARTPPDLARRASSQGWAIALTYGLTEATSQVATASPAEVARDPSPALRPLDGVEVMIAPNGEILVRGPTVSPGTLAGGPLTDGDGWLHTGDLGELDDRGHLRVTGRGTDRIVTGGVTVDAHEVADALRTHPEVEDAFAFGVPDAEWGERVVALVEPRTGREPVADAILEWLRPRVSGPKRPKTLVVVPHLPRNANRKVDRAAARGLLDD